MDLTQHQNIDEESFWVSILDRLHFCARHTCMLYDLAAFQSQRRKVDPSSLLRIGVRYFGIW